MKVKEVYGKFQLGLRTYDDRLYKHDCIFLTEGISKVDPMSVLSAFNTAFGSNEKTVGEKDAVDSLTIPQKFILCSAVLALTKKCYAVKDLTLTHVSVTRRQVPWFFLDL